MDDKIVEICLVCKIEKNFHDFYIKSRECEAYKFKRVVKPYVTKKD